MWHGVHKKASFYVREKRPVSPSPLQGHALSDLGSAIRPTLGPGVGIC